MPKVKKKRKKARAMYLTRDARCPGFGSTYRLWAAQPTMAALGDWENWKSSRGAVKLMPSQSPVELKPGEGPIKVQLVVDE